MSSHDFLVKLAGFAQSALAAAFDSLLESLELEPELVAFGQTSVRLRPVFLGGAFIGDGLPLWVVGKYDPTQTLVANAAISRGSP